MRYRKPSGTHNASVLQNVLPHLKNPLYKLPIVQTLGLVSYKGTVKLNIMSLQMNQVKKKRFHFSPISAIDMMNLLTNLQIGMIQLLVLPHHQLKILKWWVLMLLIKLNF